MDIPKTSISCAYQVKEVTTKKDFSDKLKFMKFSSIAWTHDHRGFFYQARERGEEMEKECGVK